MDRAGMYRKQIDECRALDQIMAICHAVELDMIDGKIEKEVGEGIKSYGRFKYAKITAKD